MWKLSFLILISSYLDESLSQPNVILQLIQPATERAVCPGEDVILTCRVSSTPHSSSVPPSMFWHLSGFPNLIQYSNGAPLSAQIENFYTTASFSNNDYIITSNATLKSAAFINNALAVACYSSFFTKEKIITVAGAENSPTELSANITNTTTVVLTWVPPNGTDHCIFNNYTVNITNSSCSMIVYSSNTSLTLTDLLIYAGHYSFTVAVTDSTGQHGSWSEQAVLDVPQVDTAAGQSSPNSTLILRTAEQSESKYTLVSIMPTTDHAIDEEPDLNIFIVIISVTSGALVICTASLPVVVFAIWYLRRHKKTPPDMVVYDLPVFNRRGDTIGRMTIQQNTAYESANDFAVQQNEAYESI